MMIEPFSPPSAVRRASDVNQMGPKCLSHASDARRRTDTGMTALIAMQCPMLHHHPGLETDDCIDELFLSRRCSISAFDLPVSFQITGLEWPLAVLHENDDDGGDQALSSEFARQR